jgi:hypothetical protein
MYLRECQLNNIVEDLLAEHDEEQLDRQLEPTARGITLRIASPQIQTSNIQFKGAVRPD